MQRAHPLGQQIACVCMLFDGAYDLRMFDSWLLDRPLIATIVMGRDPSECLLLEAVKGLKSLDCMFRA
jgi:hypothetical protein